MKYVAKLVPPYPNPTPILEAERKKNSINSRFINSFFPGAKLLFLSFFLFFLFSRNKVKQTQNKKLKLCLAHK